MLIYALLLAVDIAVLYYIIQSGPTGAGYVSLTVVGLVGLLLGYQVVQHLRDMSSPLAESEGVVTRKWVRADLIIALQSHYVNVERAVFRVRPEDFIHVSEGMYVKVVHFPNTLNVVSMHEIVHSPE